MGKKIHIEESLLKQKLYDEGKSQAAIAKELGVDVRVIRSCMEELGLVSNKEYKRQSLTYDVLYQRYVVEGKSIKTLHKELGCPRDWLRARLDEMGLLREASYRPSEDSREKLTQELLHDMYVEQGKSIAHIADALGYKTSTIRRYLRKYNLYEPKTSFDGMNSSNVANAKIKDDDLFRSLVEEGASVSDLAMYFGCSQDSVYRKKQELGLDNGIRQVSEAALREEYLDKMRSCDDIANDYGCSGGTIRNRLMEYDIPLRDATESARVDFNVEDVRRYLLEGLSYTAIASVVGCSMGAVRNFAIANGLDGLLKSTTSAHEVAMETALSAAGLEYEKHERKILHGKEIDFVVENVVGVEVSPCSTHNSDKGIHGESPKNPKYHMNKTRLAKDAGMILLTKFDWFVDEIIARRALTLLDPSFPCLLASVRKTRSADDVSFIEAISLEGNAICCWEAKEAHHREWQISISSTANPNIEPLSTMPLVIEALSSDGARSVEYMADSALGDDVLLERIGFEKVCNLPPVSRYVSRYGTQCLMEDEIHQISSELTDEDEIRAVMNSKGYYRVFDCGHAVMRKLLR